MQFSLFSHLTRAPYKMLSRKKQVSHDTHFDIYALFPNTKMNIIYYSLKHRCICKCIKMEQKIYVFSLPFLLVVGHRNKLQMEDKENTSFFCVLYFFHLKQDAAKRGRHLQSSVPTGGYIHCVIIHCPFGQSSYFLEKKIPWQSKNIKSLNMIIYVYIIFKSQQPFNASSIYIKITF